MFDNLTGLQTGINYQSYILSQSDLSISDNQAREVDLLRDYYDGKHRAKLDTHSKTVLGIRSDDEFSINFCSLVVDAFPERLSVTSAKVSSIDPDQDLSALNALIARWLRQSRFHLLEKQAYTGAGRDGVSYLVVDYDPVKRRPRLSVNYAWDGDDGVTAHYDPDTGELAWAVKRWRVPATASETRKAYIRMNVYHQNRVEKWVNHTSGFTPYAGDNDPIETIEWRGLTYNAAVVWWTEDGTASGEPLGIPVFPLINRNDGSNVGISDLAHLLPIQEMINKAAIDLLVISDLTAFPVWWTTSRNVPDGQEIAPGMMFKLGTDETLNRVESSDLTQPLNYLESLILLFGRLSTLNLNRFIITKQVSAEGTLKQQESAFLATCESKQALFGVAIENAVLMMLKLERRFNSQAIPLDIAALDQLICDLTWADLSPRSDLESAEVAKAVKQLGVTDQYAWEVAGIPQPRIEAMMQEQERDLRSILQSSINNLTAQTAQRLGATPNEQPTQPQAA